MRRILFVDDEPHVLEGLRDRLRRQRRRWNMVFAIGADSALAQLEANPFDIVISDLSMPGTSGAALLARVREQYPEIVRIILTGDTEARASRACIGVAHQLLLKPCTLEVLEKAVEGTCSLRDVVADETTRRAVNRIETLPTVAGCVAALRAAVARPGVELAEITHIVETDVALTLRVVQLANVAFCRRSRQKLSLGDAVDYLGLPGLKDLVLNSNGFEEREEGVLEVKGAWSKALQYHSRLANRIARRLLSGHEEAEQAALAATLHDIGKWVLLSLFPERVEAAFAAANAMSIPYHQAEDHLFGVTHAEIGAYLLALWGLPEKVVEAVGNHHRSRNVPLGDFDLLSAVQAANVLAHDAAAALGLAACAPVNGKVPLDLDDRNQILGWRAMAAEEARRLHIM